MGTHHSPPSELTPDTVDDVFAVLSNEEYRHVIQYFRQTSQSVADIESLVEFSVQHAAGDVERDNRALTLHHVVLPKLAEAGVLDYDTRHNTVRYRGWPIAEQLVSFILGGCMTSGDLQEEVVNHLENAVQADEQATKDYHVKEALQILRIADETGHGETDNTDESVE